MNPQSLTPKDAVNASRIAIDTIESSGLLPKMIRSTSNLTGPQAIAIGVVSLAFTGLAGLGIHEIAALAKANVPIELSLGKARFVANQPIQSTPA